MIYLSKHKKYSKYDYNYLQLQLIMSIINYEYNYINIS